MIGSVDNGDGKMSVKLGGFDGSGDVRVRGDTAQIAIMTKPGFMASFPRKVTVDNREMWASSARKVEGVKGLLVLTVDWTAE